MTSRGFSFKHIAVATLTALALTTPSIAGAPGNGAASIGQAPITKYEGTLIDIVVEGEGGSNANDVLIPFQWLTVIDAPDAERFSLRASLNQSDSDGVCRDVDYMKISGLVPLCAYDMTLGGAVGDQMIVGWFDKSGNLILSEINGGIFLVADANGEVNLGLSSTDDADFDGLDDASMNTHALCGAYSIDVVAIGDHVGASPSNTHPTSGDRTNGGDDGNDVFEKSEPVLVDNSIRTSINRPLAASISDGLCRDVDYYKFTNLTPFCDYLIRVDAHATPELRIGWFDLSGNRILSDVESVNLIGDANGEMIIAVTAESDFDFDGLDDATLLPHGVCSAFDYRLTIDGDDIFAAPDVVSVPNQHKLRINRELIQSPCDALCHDVDFIRFTNLVPLCEYEFQIQGPASQDFRIGWFDASGNQIISQAGTLSLVADSNGFVFLGITAATDNDFDGFIDPATPHGLCSDYALTIIPIPNNHGFLLEDLNYDGVVDTADLGLLLGTFGTDDFVTDINNDGAVDTADLGLLLARFGDIQIPK